MDLARKAYKAYWAAAKEGREAQGRRGVAGFLAGLSDANWQGYQAGRAYLFADLYNRLLEKPVPQQARDKVERMKALSALRIGLPCYERDAEYQRRLGASQDAWGGDKW